MALAPAARYQSVAELQRDIEAYQGGFATAAENAGKWKRFTLFVRRHKAASIGVAAVLVLSIGFMAKVIAEGRRAERGEAKANAALAELKASAPSLLALAESEAAFQRFDSALVKLDAALKLDPALTAGWWRRAWLLLGMARYGEAPAAFRTAQQRDPAQHAHDALLPVLDAIAAAPDDATRFPPERTEALFRHFTKVGASGELNALSQRLTLNAKQKEQMIRQRLDEWLGKGVGQVKVHPDGTVEIKGLPKATDTIEPLRGLPISALSLTGTRITNLESLKGLPLRRLLINQLRVSDLTPLRGMPLAILDIHESDVTNLSPLAGMPLEKLVCFNTRLQDLSPLRGAPLRSLVGRVNKISNLDFLAESPVEELDLVSNRVSDISVLRGKPLKVLLLGGNPISDLAPIRGMRIEELNIRGLSRPADISVVSDLPNLEKLRISKLGTLLEPLRDHPALKSIAYDDGPYLPVAEFWADYDAQQAAGKK
jgi:hypothetical protein